MCFKVRREEQTNTMGLTGPFHKNEKAPLFLRQKSRNLRNIVELLDSKQSNSLDRLEGVRAEYTQDFSETS